jgi:DNA-binding transcriptional LysR family regulator
MLDTWTLRVLTEVADQGSFSAAAESLSMTQPAVSRQIANLERRLGLVLFQRAARGVTLTPAGGAAVDEARDVLARMRTMEARLKAFSELATGEVRLSAFSSANTAFVPEAIRRFSQTYPNVAVTLESIDTRTAADAVRDGRVDVALLTDWDRPDRAGLQLKVLLHEKLHLALPIGHRLARHSPVRLSDLAGEAWIEGAHPDCLGPLSRLTDALGGPPRIAFTCEDWTGKLALVAAGAGVAVLPELAGTVVRPDVAVVTTDPPLPTRRVYAAVTPKRTRSPAATAMLAVLAELAAGHRAF